jgi:hypothetical protein
MTPQHDAYAEHVSHHDGRIARFINFGYMMSRRSGKTVRSVVALKYLGIRYGMSRPNESVFWHQGNEISDLWTCTCDVYVHMSTTFSCHSPP